MRPERGAWAFDSSPAGGVSKTPHLASMVLYGVPCKVRIRVIHQAFLLGKYRGPCLSLISKLPSFLFCPLYPHASEVLIACALRAGSASGFLRAPSVFVGGAISPNRLREADWEHS